MSVFVLDSRSPSASDRSRPAVPGKAVAGALGVLLMGATLAPIAQNWRAQPRDSFPFSYYPMFSEKRGDKYEVNYMVGLDGQGAEHVISYQLAGRGGLNSTRRQINKLVRQQQADRLCRSLADRVARDTEPPYSEIRTVQIVTGWFRFADYFAGNKTPASKRVHASCEVARP